MSRSYDMTLRVCGVSDDECDILEDCDAVSPFTSTYETPGSWETDTRAVHLSGGVSPEDYLVELSHGIWAALECYVKVELDVVYIEQAPQDTFMSEVSDYQTWEAANAS